MNAVRICDKCKKAVCFIEYEHQGVITQKSWCSFCSWFHIVEDGEEVFRGVSDQGLEEGSKVHELQHLKEFKARALELTHRNAVELYDILIEEFGGID